MWFKMQNNIFFVPYIPTGRYHKEFLVRRKNCSSVREQIDGHTSNY